MDNSSRYKYRYDEGQSYKRRSYDDYEARSEKRKRYDDSDAPIPKLYSVFSGEVASLQPYGAFIKIPNTTRHGLVHKSQMSKGRIDDPSEFLSVRERVWCKVISIEEEGRRIALSMRCVNQSTGEDEDPNNIKSTRFDGFKKSSREPIHLGAYLDTTCRKCGGKGHMAQDCFHARGQRGYELVPELESDSPQTPPPHSPPREKKHKDKKSKKEKKEKKSKKRKFSESDGDMLGEKQYKEKSKTYMRQSSSDSSSDA